MTPQEMIEDRMLTLWGERNIARLSRESGVPRESLSKILAHKRGLGDEVARKIAEPLNLPAEALVPPAAEAVTLGSLDRRLQSLAAELARAVALMEDALALLREAPPRAAQGGRRR